MVMFAMARSPAAASRSHITASSICPQIARRASLPDAEAAHEAVADLRGVALGGVRRLAGIDAAADQPRTVLTHREIDQLLERALVRRPVTLRNAGAARDRHHVGALFRRRL